MAMMSASRSALEDLEMIRRIRLAGMRPATAPEEISAAIASRSNRLSIRIPPVFFQIIGEPSRIG
jgi:hypothetical protein